MPNGTGVCQGLRQGNVADAATIRAGWLRDCHWETHSVREFLELAFGYVNLNWQDYIEFDERYLRPSEVELLMEIHEVTAEVGLVTSVTFEQLVALMVEADLQALGHTSRMATGYRWFRNCQWSVGCHPKKVLLSDSPHYHAQLPYPWKFPFGHHLYKHLCLRSKLMV